MADISTLEEGITAERAGAAIVSTTLCGYTSYTSLSEDADPSFDLLEELVRHVECPVVAEGRIWTPEEACMVLSKGAFAVTVGSAITRPQLITERCAQQLSKHWAAMCAEA
jgi:N-acylglucosamine-6-phosphate 2-epimerase